LNLRAEALARRLRGMGVGPEVVVALMAERSIELVVGLLGVLKAGGAYLPIDPDYPRERIAFMLSNSRVSVFVTQRKFAERVPAENRHVLILDDKSWEAETADPANVVATPGPLNLAYVIYTSGSTGVPKGAMNTHGAIVNRLLWMQDAYCLTPEDTVLQKTPFTFDVSVWEFFWPLLAGAQLVLARPGGHRESEYLVDLIARQHVTVLHFVPSMLQVFLQEPRLERCQSLKRVICSGEALPYDLQERFFERLPSVELHNLYGPTEAAVDVSYWQCERGSPRASVPIGRPIANVQLYVLDKSLEPAPVGGAGEIYIGGVGLARGYLDMPGLTAEKFIPSPFGPGVGSRLYRTGDMGRYLVNASIEFLGRLDDQVKVRGFRVEPGEIELLLRSHTSVGDCAVVARRRGPADDRLVAYVVAKEGGSAPSAAELRRYLREHLPEYMVPSVFTTIQRLPLTSSGKVDRRSLPEPERGQLEPGEEYLASRTPVEEVVADVWAHVLGVERVGVRDNFFELGGHSLLGTQVVSRVRAALGVELGLSVLFDAPTVEGMSREVERELAAGRKTMPPLKRVERVGDLPLSFAQQRLWFLQQLEPNSRTYNMPFALRLKGTLNVDALRKSFNELIRRHEVLRTVFRKVDGEPKQVIEEAADVNLPITDLQDLPESEREKQIERALLEEADHVFDLARGPLCHVSLLRISKDEHVLLYTMHHIISDGWSMNILSREMAGLYKAFSENQPSPLAELPVQYADYAVWQREWLQGEVLDQQLSYWRRQLAGAPSAIDLPTDRPRPPLRSFRGANVGLILDGVLTAQLKELSRRENATLYMTLLAAFKLLLARVAVQECVVVGTPIAGRRQTEVEGLIGFFVNTLVLRTEVSGDLTFRELLARVRKVTIEAYSNQDLPFEKLVDELQSDRDLSRSPLFQVNFSFGTEKHEQEGEGFGQLDVTPLNSENRTAKFDLTLTLSDNGDRLIGSIEYSVDLFDEATIARLARHYVSLLEDIVADPDRLVSRLSLLTNEERKTLLEDWNQTAVDYALSESVSKMFEQHVASTPGATALVCGDVSLTYGELNRRANQLGHELQALGVGLESRVGIMVQRSIDMIVGLLAILKAGGAYVPLDPNYPRERLNFMAGNSELQIVLTQQWLSNQLPDGVSTVIFLDTDRTIVEEPATENLNKQVFENSLAYVLYTSGSTGQPKGVMVPHGGLTNYLKWGAAAYNVTSGCGAPVHSPLGFDFTVTTMLIPLISGQTVTLLKESQGIEELRETIRGEPGFSYMKVTPAHLDMLNQVMKEHEIAGAAKCLVIGGDALFGESLPFWQKNAPNIRLINEYGPTETTVGCSIYEIDPDMKLTGAVPIGRPIANTQLYVLDSTLQPVPIGVPGELYIGGACLARGYLTRPELTAETFIPDPFCGAPGQRLYKTGDLARYLADGNLVYLGRADRQLKIRGFRIEAGDVEAALRHHEGVRDAAVIASGSDHSELRLLAFVVAQEGKSAVKAVELREFLKERIPEYMVPDTFVTIDEIPLTTNGKVDYKKLASIAAAYRPPTEFVAPRNTVELELAHIWEDTLNLPRVGVTDKFFEIGGNSFLAVRLMSRIEKQFGKELPLATLFQAPTVEQLASAVHQHVGPEAWRPLVAIQPRGARPPFFCIHPIGGTVLCYYDLARHLGEDQPFYALQAPGLLEEEDCQTSIEDMATRYIRELREVQPSGPYWLGGYSFGGVVAFEMAQQLLRDGQSVALLALFDGGAPNYASRVSDEVEDSLILAELLKERARNSGQELRIPHEEILATMPEDRLSHVLNMAKTAGVVPVEIELEWVTRFLRGFKLRAEAASRYMPRIFPGRLTFFRSTEVDRDTVKTMERMGVDLNDLTRGWSELSAEPIEVIRIPGYHETLMLEPYVQKLAESLRSYLNQPEDKKKSRSI
jgi:amino acid adenylation domain-containing protein